MSEGVILLVEDNPDDELLALRALRKNNVKNEVVVAHDGVEALDYLFASGPHAGRDPSTMPRLILLDLKLPKVDGLEVLKRLRSDERTRLLPVVILTSSEERKTCSTATASAPTATSANRSTSNNSSGPSSNSSSTGSA